MFSYRVTKYNPAYRNEQGWYLRDDWTEYGDIGKKYNNEIVTLDEYLKMENNYIQAVIAFMQCNKVTSFQVTKIERGYDPAEDPNSTQGMINIYRNIKNRSLISENNLENICKLMLRRYLWGLLRNNKLMEIRFGHDYYMVIKSKLACKKTVTNIEKLGLFVEDYEY
jgi:hypothetical protein